MSRRAGGDEGKHPSNGRGTPEAPPARTRAVSARSGLARRLVCLHLADRGRCTNAFGQGAPNVGEEARCIRRVPRDRPGSPGLGATRAQAPGRRARVAPRRRDQPGRATADPDPGRSGRRRRRRRRPSGADRSRDRGRRTRQPSRGRRAARGDRQRRRTAAREDALRPVHDPRPTRRQVAGLRRGVRRPGRYGCCRRPADCA